MYPKNFRKIQAYLEWKSLQDCINYYYTNKYKLDLKRTLRQHQSKRRGREAAMLVADRAPQHTTAPSVGRGSSVSADVADESYVVNPFRTGMRARPRNFSYKETDLSGTSLAATGGGGGGDGDGGGGFPRTLDSGRSPGPTCPRTKYPVQESLTSI